ncbi:4-(cytidine 5'-diphospho)-2-C-methyl-D-erythritol kinase [Streptosporangium sp. KLBMP 9127]|nr:4-(cytidine 5'-diphospho)-2-C-methyl-D-erythritol kinase [Streptosporangium sp. KLBMP 9127]
MPTNFVTVRVPAKVNVQLAVGPLRADGYHDLVNVFHAVSIYDDVTATEAAAISVEVESEVAGLVPLDGDNLAVRAARALAVRSGRPYGARLKIRKSIPVAGGMAGGSADAAGALVACNELWGLAMSDSELMEIGAELGSDVPFALLGGTAVGTGRGERLTPVEVSGRFHWVFALADGGLSTPAVYAECDRLRAAQRPGTPPLDGPRAGESRTPGAGGSRTPGAGESRTPVGKSAGESRAGKRAGEPKTAEGWRAGEPQASAGLLAALRAGDAKALGAELANDLQPAALSLRPSLGRTLAAGRGVLGAIVSGSGPTCAFLVAGEAEAVELAASLRASGVCQDAVTAHGPVHGALGNILGRR